jgi:hypothetical protein
MIFVDELRRWPNPLLLLSAGICHLTTDGPLEELHAFATKMDLKKDQFKTRWIGPHYRLTVSQRERAILQGAIFIGS